MLKLIERTTDLPVSLADIKEHLGIVHDEDDSRITDLIWTASDFIENHTGRDFVGHGWNLILPRFPHRNDPITVPRSPVADIASVSFRDASGDVQSLGDESYIVLNPHNGPCEIYPVPGSYWPSTAIRPDAVTVSFTAGGDVPPLFVHTVKAIVGHLNENREGQATDTKGLDRLLMLLCDGRYK